MIKLNIYGIEAAKEYPDMIKNQPPPEFAGYEEDITGIVKAVEPYQKYSKIIVIGSGGAVNPFRCFARALKGNGKQVFILDTIEPDLIVNLKKDYQKENTVIVCVSKSGTTVTTIEAVLQFRDYQVVVVTENQESALYKIAANYNWKIIPHPSVGGRFSSFCAPAFVPAQLFGLPISRLQAGAKKMFARCELESPPGQNPAWQIASAWHRLYLVGKDEIYLTLYSYYLETATQLFNALFHESLGKDGKGLTTLAVVGPESQHNSNQRFFGGKRNISGLFITIKNQRHSELVNLVESAISEIKLYGGKLSDINQVSLAQSLAFEFEGTKKTCEEKKVPYIQIELEKMDSENLAELIALIQTSVYYLGQLLELDPFSQPEIERGKEISFSLRKNASQENKNRL